MYLLFIILKALEFFKCMFISNIIINFRYDEGKKRLEMLRYVLEAKSQNLGQKLGQRLDMRSDKKPTKVGLEFGSELNWEVRSKVAKKRL